jgi:hypothetical protein
MICTDQNIINKMFEKKKEVELVEKSRYAWNYFFHKEDTDQWR